MYSDEKNSGRTNSNTAEATSSQDLEHVFPRTIKLHSHLKVNMFHYIFGFSVAVLNIRIRVGMFIFAGRDSEKTALCVQMKLATRVNSKGSGFGVQGRAA